VSVLVENRRQVRKVRFLCWGSVLWCIGMIYWAADLSQTYGLAPPDGGVLRPPLQRWTFAAIMALIGILPFIGLLIYARLYVIRLVRDRAEVGVTVIGFLMPSTRTFTLVEVGNTRDHHGQFRSNITVNAPWMVLRIAGRPFVIDLQADLVDRGAIRRLTFDAARARGV
jgi:hypothetical protein